MTRKDADIEEGDATCASSRVLRVVVEDWQATG
jgi:hypothetical protein